MIVKDYGRYDGLGLAELVRRKEVSPADLVETALDAIERLNPHVNCVVQTLREQALGEIADGLPLGPLRGVPFVVKEFGMHFKGMISSAGSRLAEGYRHGTDSVMMERCRAAGMVAVGTTTLPEMAFNASTESLLYGPTRNPWNLDYATGGSSGGAGASVGCGMVPIAHANDGAGSIRIPAACNGVVGMKVSRGRTPGGPDLGMLLWGLGVEFFETRTVRDSAAMLDIVGGTEAGCFYTAPPPRRSFLAAAHTLPPRLRIGVVEQMPGACDTGAEQRARLADTVELLEQLGHRCEPLNFAYDNDAFVSSTLPLWAVTLGHYMHLFARETGRDIGPETTEAVTLEIYRYGASLKAFEMEAAMSTQNAITRQAVAAMQPYDVVLTPALARDIARIGELDQNAKNLDMRGWWRQIIQDYSPFTPLFNTTGQPAIMLPLWQAESGLPLAMQFAGRLGDEETLYSLAGELEQALPWAARKPDYFA